MIAAGEGHEEVCKVLLEADSDVKAVDMYGRTALMLASLRGHKEVCRLLLEVGSEVKVVGADGSTALMEAAKGGYQEICELLLSNGALIDRKVSSYLKTHIAPTPKIVESLLLQRMFDHVFNDYAKAAQLMLPGFLLEHFISIKKMNRKGFSALHFAAINKESSTLEFLLGHDMVVVNQSVRDFKQNSLIDSSDNREGLSPIRLALKYGRIENAKPLYTKWFSQIE